MRILQNCSDSRMDPKIFRNSVESSWSSFKSRSLSFKSRKQRIYPSINFPKYMCIQILQVYFWRQKFSSRDSRGVPRCCAGDSPSLLRYSILSPPTRTDSDSGEYWVSSWDCQLTFEQCCNWHLPKTIPPKVELFVWNKSTESLLKDRLFLACSFSNCVVNIHTKASNAPNHKAIKLSLELSEERQSPGLWKFNNTLADDEEYLNCIRENDPIEV